jgi:hypothetical protein
MSSEEIGGYRVTIERLWQGRREEHVFGAKDGGGHHGVGHAHQQARKKGGFVRVLKAEALTAAQYAKEFPAGQRARSIVMAKA